ncbi:glycosyltransferase family 2 protein [Pseudohaliea sp.]|uniref:glycosyltransferase family 2 protein n=1 Tax=Pseudohaliea sp. TaxID=2740289 RepID=UPI0032ED8C22
MPPKVNASIILATRNRLALLEQTLASIAQLDTEGIEWELIIVDNDGGESASSTIELFSSRLPIKALHEPKPGKNRALNKALDHANGELFLFLDNDVSLPSGWLKGYLDAATRWPDDDIFGGPVWPVFPAGTPEWMASARFPFAAMAFGRYEPGVIEGPVSNPPYGANLAMRAGVFEDVRYNPDVGPDGTKNYRMGSETELLLRLAQKGHRFIFVPEVSVNHVITADQTEVDWLVRRATRDGRQAAAALQNFKGKRIFGVPRYLLRGLMEETASLAASMLAGPEARCICRMQYAKTWEMIKETRRSHPQPAVHR